MTMPGFDLRAYGYHVISKATGFTAEEFSRSLPYKSFF
jgi:hypothetical protein